ncbi:hypothetical protein RHMOL_Rhmol01G0003000 [Rhododendron molle]|uniref:Uncharacterized protein n=1 Tax=Rhododendron molle TaxID=49168 RepID=A0ACC0PY05_RHOML|nr:hypothetical protein RHMOL_Rhmol01G0003000 [Rhododendron molle]
MDSSSQQNWLGFSLSNHHHHLPSDSSHLSVFQAFTTPNPHSHSGVVDNRQGEDASGATDLSIFTGGGCGVGPKLEDFLGGSGCSSAAAGDTDACHFTGEAQEIYDSELKTIAASFLRAFSSEQIADDDAQKQLVVVSPPEQAAKKAVDTFGQRTSIYRGVTRSDVMSVNRHRWTGRYEAHLWDNSCRREGQSRKGRQGGYDKEDKAARAYDLAALKYWGPTTTTNFPVSNYEKELEEMTNMTRQEFVASLRRKSSGFSRGASIYRGVTRHHQHGRWQARIGRVAGNKDLYLGTFTTQEEAAEAYDIAAIKFRGLNAVTNFDMSRYDVKSIANSNLPIGGITGKSTTQSDSASDNKSIDGGRLDDRDHLSSASSVNFPSQPPSSTLSFAIPIKQDSTADYWSMLGYPSSSNSLTNAKHPSATTPLFQPSNSGTSYQGTTPFSMDFCNTGSSTISNHNNGIFNGGGYLQLQQHQQSISSSTSTSSSGIAFATPIALNSSNSYEQGSSYGNWVAPSPLLHSFQSAKPNLPSSVFQTPIFGME